MILLFCVVVSFINGIFVILLMIKIFFMEDLKLLFVIGRIFFGGIVVINC